MSPIIEPDPLPEVGRRPLVPWLVAGIATVAALWVARQNLALNAELDTQSLAASTTQLKSRALRQQLEAEQLISKGEIAQIRQALAATDPASLQITLLAPPAGGPAGPRGVALWNPLSAQGVVVSIGLPPAAAGEDYQLWLVPSGSGPAGPAATPATPLAGGMLTVDPATGEARQPFKTNGHPPGTFTVTREDHGPVATPAGAVVLTSR
jgi:hypothetical protein